jgi:type IV pilus biogenesis protein CpaD/CtpE
MSVVFHMGVVEPKKVSTKKVEVWSAQTSGNLQVGFGIVSALFHPCCAWRSDSIPAFGNSSNALRRFMLF